MRFLIVFLLLILYSAAHAQDRPVELKEGETLSGSFSQKRFLSGFDRPIVSQGSFYFAQAQGIVWKTASPFKTELVIDKTGIRQSVDGEETIHLSSDQFPILQTLHDVLSLSMQGQWGALEKEFGAILMPHADGWSLSFDAPKDAPFESIHLEGSEYLKKIIIAKPEGDKDEIIFSDQTVLLAK